MKLHKLFIVLLLISLNGSCKTSYNKSQVQGKYIINRKFNFVDYLLFRWRRMSDSIYLKNDGTYYYSNCSIVEHGKWVINNNKIILHCSNKEYKNDSLNKLPEIDTLTCNSSSKFFIIKRKKLIRRMGLRHIIEFLKIK